MTHLTRKQKSNCVWYALDQLNTVGGKLQTRASSHWQWRGRSLNLHAQHIARSGKMTHFVPPADLPTNWHSLTAFEGDVIDYDTEDDGPASAGSIAFGVSCLFVLMLMWIVRRPFTKNKSTNP